MDPLDEVFPFPLSEEEAKKEIKRIFGSFNKEFKVATVHMLRAKVLVRLKEVQKAFPDKSAMEQLEVAWAEIALETMMIMTDALTKSASLIADQEIKLKAVAHLMPPVEQGKPS